MLKTLKKSATSLSSAADTHLPTRWRVSKLRQAGYPGSEFLAATVWCFTFIKRVRGDVNGRGATNVIRSERGKAAWVNPSWVSLRSTQATEL